MNERTFKEWSFGVNAQIYLETFLEGNKSQWEKDRLIQKLTEAYFKTKKQ